MLILKLGDAVHSIGHRWIPRIARGDMLMRVRTLASMQRLADVLNHYKAQLWIQHDIDQFNKQKEAPEYYE